MIYTIYYNEVSLPGSNTDQYVLERYESKEEFLKEIQRFFVENKQTIFDLDDDGTPEFKREYRNIIKRLKKLLESKDIESLNLECECFEIGSYMISIELARPYPDVLRAFADTVYDVSNGIFDEYMALSEEEIADRQEWGDYMLDAYLALSKINENTTEEEFKAAFSEISSVIGNSCVFG